MRLRCLRIGGSLLLALLAASLGCGLIDERPRYAFTPAEFREEVRVRLPHLGAPVEVPFEVGPGALERARATIYAAPRGHARIVALVDMLHEPPPEGLGLRYAATRSQTAFQTLESGEGNCVALASVLVGLGRGLGWPVYYGEALVNDEEIVRNEDLAIRADHMVVVIIAQTVKAVVDFTGPVEGYGVRIIDDVHAYAHLINNRASEQILSEIQTGAAPDWDRALAGFAEAAQLAPELARAWNNQGVALARLGRIDAARSAYAEALRMDANMGSPQQNLIVLETRARGETSIRQQPTALPASELP